MVEVFSFFKWKRNSKDAQATSNLNLLLPRASGRSSDRHQNRSCGLLCFLFFVLFFVVVILRDPTCTMCPSSPLRPPPPTASFLKYKFLDLLHSSLTRLSRRDVGAQLQPRIMVMGRVWNSTPKQDCKGNFATAFAGEGRSSSRKRFSCSKARNHSHTSPHIL